MRKILMALIAAAQTEIDEICNSQDSCDVCPAGENCWWGLEADYLIAHGVTIKEE